MLGDVNGSFGTYLFSHRFGTTAKITHRWRISMHGPGVFEAREPSPKARHIVTPWILLLETMIAYFDLSAADLRYGQHSIPTMNPDPYIEGKPQNNREIFPCNTFRVLICYYQSGWQRRNADLVADFLQHNADLESRHHLRYKVELPSLVRYEIFNPILSRLILDIELSVSTLVQHIFPPATGESLKQLLHRHGAKDYLQIIKVNFYFVPEHSPQELRQQCLVKLETGFDALSPCLRCMYANNLSVRFKASDPNPFCSKTTRFIQSVLEQLESVLPHPVRQRVPQKPADERIAARTWLDLLAPFQDEDGELG